MNFVMWLLKRIKTSLGWQSLWVSDYRHAILHDKGYSIFLTLGIGFIYVVTVGWVCIHFIDQTETAQNTVVGLIASVAVFYVYHWIMALHEVYEKEKQNMWEILKQ
jgi:hypothetical protein